MEWVRTSCFVILKNLILILLLLIFSNIMSTINIFAILLWSNRQIKCQGIDWILQNNLHRTYAIFHLQPLCIFEWHWWHTKNLSSTMNITPPKNFWGIKLLQCLLTECLFHEYKKLFNLFRNYQILMCGTKTFKKRKKLLLQDRDSKIF